MLIYIDVETTGVGIEDVVCSIATLCEDANSLQLSYDLVNEGKKIPPIASSINNITNEMIKDAPPLLQSSTFKKLMEKNKDALLIAHNVTFELSMLGKSGFVFDGECIDTLRVTRHLIPDLESYTLNFLRYEMRLYKQEKRLMETLGVQELCLQPHNAQSDVIIAKLLLDELGELASLDEMVELTKRPVLVQKFEFGKYSGRYIEEIANIDRGYLEWMLRTIEDLSEDMRYSLEYYL